MAKRDVGRSYWLPAAIPFTATLNETVFGTTVDAKADLNILGGLTNLTGATVKVNDVSGRLVLTADLTPVLSLFGKRDSARPMFYYPRSIPLGFGNRIEVEAKNDAAEAASHVVFVGIPDEPPQAQIEGIEEIGQPFIFAVDSKFTATLNEIKSPTTPEQETHFLIHGAFTNLASAQLRIQGVHGEQWTSDFTPVWAFAGRATSQLTVHLWPRPYLVPRGSTLTIDFKNVGTEASGKLWLVGQKLPIKL